jgi:hypothetical protein
MNRSVCYVVGCSAPGAEDRQGLDADSRFGGGAGSFHAQPVITGTGPIVVSAVACATRHAAGQFRLGAGTATGGTKGRLRIILLRHGMRFLQMNWRRRQDSNLHHPFR